jgi:hypothetical protein
VAHEVNDERRAEGERTEHGGCAERKLAPQGAYLQLLREVRVLHGQIHGALEPRVTVVLLLLVAPAQRHCHVLRPPTHAKPACLV